MHVVGVRLRLFRGFVGVIRTAAALADVAASCHPPYCWFVLETKGARLALRGPHASNKADRAVEALRTSDARIRGVGVDWTGHALRDGVAGEFCCRTERSGRTEKCGGNGRAARRAHLLALAVRSAELGETTLATLAREGVEDRGGSGAFGDAVAVAGEQGASGA